MSFGPLNETLLATVKSKLEALEKSFAAGYPRMEGAGRTGTAALSREQLDPEMRSITLEESDFLLTKDIPTIKATQSVFQYSLKTSVRSGLDLAGTEAFLPQEDHQKYMVVAEVLKVYGIRKSITQMAQLINDAGGYNVNLEKENDLHAALAIAENMERDLYIGGDMFIDASGNIDSKIASDPNGPIRNVRGLQANIREGDKSERGRPGDFIGYGNDRSVVFDFKGSIMDRSLLDRIVTAVRDSRGLIAEGHCTTSQLAEFRSSFFPTERSDLATIYAIKGPAINNDEKVRVPVDTVGGNVDFIASVFKYKKYLPVPVGGSVGAMPSTPVISGTAASASITGSGFEEGQVFTYRVQAVNINGMSYGSAISTHTVGVGDADKAIEVTITNQPGVEYFQIFRSRADDASPSGKEMLIGRMLPQSGVSSVFRDKDALMPGLDSVVFLPRNKHRPQLAVLGGLLNKLELGLRGLASETVYASYFGLVVDRPRTYALAENVHQVVEEPDIFI